RDQIAILLLEVDGQVVAAQAFLEIRGCVAVYYSGFDERVYRYSPLTVIIAEAIRLAIERGASRVEFPPTITPWKSRWGTLEHRAIAETSLYSIRKSALARGLLRRQDFRVVPRT